MVRKKIEVVAGKAVEVVAKPVKSVAPASVKPAAPRFVLKRFPQGIFRDIYGNPATLAPCMLWVNSEVLHILNGLADSSLKGRIIVSDTYRTPVQSYIARKQKGNIVAPCGLSGHNYGLSIDIDVTGTLAALGIVYPVLVDRLRALGIFGIRNERWHFNLMYANVEEFFHGLYDKMSPELLAHIKKNMVARFSNAVVPVKNVKAIQSELGLTVDGVIGRQTVMSVSMFLADRMGMFNVNDAAKQELTVDFGDIWEF